MKILIIGGSGFVGKAVLKVLLKKGEHQITAIRHKNDLGLESHPSLRIVSGSLKTIIDLIEGEKPQLIISCARISGGRFKWGRKWVSFLANRLNTKLKKYLINHQEIKFVFLSGSLMYGSSKSPIKEDNPLAPISFAKEYYFAEKPFVEKLSPNSMILRACWVFSEASWFKQFYLNPMAIKKKVPQYGKGANIMSIIHLEDLAHLVVLYATNAKYGNVYNIFSPIKCTGKQFSMALKECHNMEIESYSQKTIEKKYNKTIFEAFASDINFESNYNEILNEYNFKFKNLKDLFFLKNK